jgi:hypothetical protein
MGDIVLRLTIAFVAPFLLLFGFFNFAFTRIVGPYITVLVVLDIISSFALIILRKKPINVRNIVFFVLMGKTLAFGFIFFLVFILSFLIEWRIPYLYEYIGL